MHYVTQWPGAYCKPINGCCYPETGKSELDFYVSALWPASSDDLRHQGELDQLLAKHQMPEQKRPLCVEEHMERLRGLFGTQRTRLLQESVGSSGEDRLALDQVKGG
ncbi:hypothetical protein QJS10_CPB12g00919 [Acorus calamus]|uniref:Uncharacterized protein n=1 Tax=Acorus calamus TaxID=4465 RepID=A0AAV9DJ87_ACOCL|nr:hypothetical protein QJS10_CPB12g00919 [Acorus calamus]